MEKEALLCHLVYKTQYGSRLYGTNGPKSDTDWKYLFLPTFKDVLLGNQVLKTKFVSPNMEDKSLQVDEDFVPVQKFARDFLKGVPYALEVAFSANGSHAEQKFLNPNFEQFVKELTEKFTNKKLSGFLGFVNKTESSVSKMLHGAEEVSAKDMYHGLRVSYQARELLATGKLTLPFKDGLRDRLLSVKNGDVHPSKVAGAFLDSVAVVNNELQHTSLQELTPELEAKFDNWLFGQLQKMYGLK